MRRLTLACCGNPSLIFRSEQHTKQTVDFNVEARRRAFEKPRASMGIWEAMELLNTLVDASDPDTDATQIEHLLQTAEAMRKDGKPDWMQVTGLIHDLGKLLYFFDSDGQWVSRIPSPVCGIAERSRRMWSVIPLLWAARFPRRKSSTRTPSGPTRTWTTPSTRPNTGSTSPTAVSTRS